MKIPITIILLILVLPLSAQELTHEDRLSIITSTKSNFRSIKDLKKSKDHIYVSGYSDKAIFFDSFNHLSDSLYGFFVKYDENLERIWHLYIKNGVIEEIYHFDEQENIYALVSYNNQFVTQNYRSNKKEEYEKSIAAIVIDKNGQITDFRDIIHSEYKLYLVKGTRLTHEQDLIVAGQFSSNMTLLD